MISDSWNKTESETMSQKVIGKIKPGVPVRAQIEFAQKKLRLQISKLESITEKLKKQHDAIFDKIVNAQKVHNNSYAKAYAAELVQIKKMHNMVNGARLSMEQINLRLNTVSELGDVVVTLSPCMSIIRGLAPTLNGILPEANASMQDLSQIMGDLMQDSSLGNADTLSISSGSNADAMAILDEAHSVIVGQTKESVPEIPESLRDEPARKQPPGITV